MKQHYSDIYLEELHACKSWQLGRSITGLHKYMFVKILSFMKINTCAHMYIIASTYIATIEIPFHKPIWLHHTYSLGLCLPQCF